MMEFVPGPRGYPILYSMLGAFSIYWQRVILAIALVKGMATEFNLSTVEQGEILSSFFIGYIAGGTLSIQVLQRNPMPHNLPSGAMAMAVGISSICTLYMSEFAKTKDSLENSRMIAGFFQGFFFPAAYGLFSQTLDDAARRTVATGRLASGVQISIAFTYVFSAAIPFWHHATFFASLSGIPPLLMFFLGRAPPEKQMKLEDDEFVGTCAILVNNQHHHCNSASDLSKSSAEICSASIDMDTLKNQHQQTYGSSQENDANESVINSEDEVSSSKAESRQGQAKGPSHYIHVSTIGLTDGYPKAGACELQEPGNSSQESTKSSHSSVDFRIIGKRRGEDTDETEGRTNDCTNTVVEKCSALIANPSSKQIGSKRIFEDTPHAHGPPQGAGSKFLMLLTLPVRAMSSGITALEIGLNKITNRISHSQIREGKNLVNITDDYEVGSLPKRKNDNSSNFNGASSSGQSKDTPYGKDAAYREGTHNDLAYRDANLLKVIFTSQFLTIIGGHFCHNWSHYILMMWLPTFFGKTNAAASAFPYFVSAFVSPLYPVYVQKQLHKGRDLWSIRREMGIVALLSPAFLLILVSSIENHYLQCICFTGILVAGGAIHSSVLSGPLDLAGEAHAGALMGISNTLASIPGIVGVRAAAYIQEAVGWSGVFLSCSCFYLFAFVIYMSFGSVKRII